MLVAEFNSLWLYSSGPCFLAGGCILSVGFPPMFKVNGEPASHGIPLTLTLLRLRAQSLLRVHLISSGPQRQSPYLKVSWFDTSITWAKPSTAVLRLVFHCLTGRCACTSGNLGGHFKNVSYNRQIRILMSPTGINRLLYLTTILDLNSF